MALRGKLPEKKEKRLKMMLFGASNSGKTTMAIGMPKPYVIDAEKGTENDEYVDTIIKNGGVVFNAVEFSEILDEVKTLLTVKHDYKTLIIDPLTNIYQDLILQAEAKGIASDFGKSTHEANKQIKQLLKLLMRLDMNIVITSHEKDNYGSGMQVIGQTFDCYKKLDYLFDLVLNMQYRAGEYYAKVVKTRIKGFPKNESFKASYEEMSNRYGRDILERDAVPELLASKEQINELNRLVSSQKINQETVGSWLTRADASNFGEMKSEHIQKCIDMLTKRLTNHQAKVQQKKH